MTAQGRKRILIGVAILAFAIEGGRHLWRALYGEPVRFFEVVDERGMPVPTAVLEGGFMGIGRDRNLLRVPEGTGDKPLRVYARGYRIATAVPQGARTKVVLQRGIAITLRLPDDYELPEPPRSVVVDLQGDGGIEGFSGVGLANPTESGQRQSNFDPPLCFEPPARTLDLLVSSPGHYRVSLRTATVFWLDKGHFTAEDTPPAEAGTIEVRDTEAAQEFEVGR